MAVELPRYRSAVKAGTGEEALGPRAINDLVQGDLDEGELDGDERVGLF